MLGVDPEAHDWWDVFCWARSSRAHEYLNVCVEQEDLEYMSVYVCVQWEALEHMSMKTFVLSMKLWSTWKDKLEVLGISPADFQVDVEHKL